MPNDLWLDVLDSIHVIHIISVFIRTSIEQQDTCNRGWLAADIILVFCGILMLCKDNGTLDL